MCRRNTSVTWPLQIWKFKYVSVIKIDFYRGLNLCCCSLPVILWCHQSILIPTLFKTNQWFDCKFLPPDKVTKFTTTTACKTAAVFHINQIPIYSSSWYTVAYCSYTDNSACNYWGYGDIFIHHNFLFHPKTFIACVLTHKAVMTSSSCLDNWRLWPKPLSGFTCLQCFWETAEVPVSVHRTYRKREWKCTCCTNHMGQLTNLCHCWLRAHCFEII